MILKPPLYLASRSPRRKRLLGEAGFEPIVIDSGFDDSRLLPGPAVSAAEWAGSLAGSKAEAGLATLRHRGVASGTILAADTICVIGGIIEGQPEDEEDARRMLRAMRNHRHEVITAVALRSVTEPSMNDFPDQASVCVGEISDVAIETYLGTGEWRGKAGAYNLVERQEAGWPVTVEGDPTTVMGLPIQRLIPLLAPLRKA